MASVKTYRRSIVEGDVMFSMVDRVNRVLIRLSNNINDSSQYPSLDELLILCTALSPKACIPFSRQFVCRCVYWLVLYFWLIVEGEAWIRNIIKKALKVVLLFCFVE